MTADFTCFTAIFTVFYLKMYNIFGDANAAQKSCCHSKLLREQRMGKRFRARLVRLCGRKVDIVLCFSIASLLWMCVSGKYIETLSFACTFYVLRSRMGGYHAKLPWLCVTTSIVIVITITMLIGPLLSRIPLLPSLIGSFLIYIVTYFTKPIYPPQANFTREAIVENNKKKNHLLIIVFLLQTSASLASLFNIGTYLFCGVLLTQILVSIEKARQHKGGKNYEIY